MAKKKFKFKRISSIFNSEIINIKFKLIEKESIIVTIARNTPCRLQIKTEEKLCGWEVGTKYS